MVAEVCNVNSFPAILVHSNEYLNRGPKFFNTGSTGELAGRNVL